MNVDLNEVQRAAREITARKKKKTFASVTFANVSSKHI